MSIAAFWDAAADSFDEQADHGLRDPHARAARLAARLPDPPTDIVDIGCGTGSLTVLLAQLGHRVTGIDLSPTMVDHARRKLAAANLDVRVLVADAADPAPLGTMSMSSSPGTYSEPFPTPPPHFAAGSPGPNQAADSYSSRDAGPPPPPTPGNASPGPVE